MSRHDDAQQCFLAALAGATYVSILSGRVNNMGYDSVKEIETLRFLLDGHDLKAKSSLHPPRNIECHPMAAAGAHIVTVAPQFIDGMLVHPYTKETVQNVFG